MEDLYPNSGAAQFGIDKAQFTAILDDVISRCLPPRASPSERQCFVRSLHLADLMLARACASGTETAWEELVSRYRERLWRIALSITREETTARDLADSLYADLIGSRFNSYSGRGTLESWLRAVMAREYVNRTRRDRGKVSLEELPASGIHLAARADTLPGAPHPTHVELALDKALAQLPPEDRFLLASYYVDGRTLAQIAAVLRVHESTISRRIERITKALRKAASSEVRRFGLSARAVEEMLQTDVRDIEVDVRRRLTAKP